jgi:predicted  nucleic acid-binding Zn-ribbon protein
MEEHDLDELQELMAERQKIEKQLTKLRAEHQKLKTLLADARKMFIEAVGKAGQIEFAIEKLVYQRKSQFWYDEFERENRI